MHILFFPVFCEYQLFVSWRFEPAVLYCRLNSLWQTNYTQINSLAGLRESVTVSARSCWIYECPLQIFAQKPAAKYQNVLLLGLPTSLHTTIQTAGTSKMKLFCCYVGKIIKTYNIMTEITHAHTHDKQQEAAFSVTVKSKSVRFGLYLC